MSERQLRREMAKVIQDLRKHFEFSKEQLAEFLNISLGEYMGIEYGIKALSASQLIKLSNLYDVSPMYFYDKKIRDKHNLIKYKYCGYNPNKPEEDKGE